MVKRSHQPSKSISRWLLLLCIALSPGSAGCSWVKELIMINTIDRPCSTEGLTKVERVRKFEENFLRERNREAIEFID